MHFTKMHGIGNDFILVNCLGPDGSGLAAEAETNAAALNDRHFGIGGDGLLLLLPGSSTAYRMRMLNPDGSEAEMCGNGIRCFAKYLYDNDLTFGKTDVPVETGAGLLHLHCLISSDGKAGRVRVDMGEPRLNAREVPTTLAPPDTRAVSVPLAIDGADLAVTCVSMGNPHAVAFVDNAAACPVDVWGPQVEKHPAFPKRTNTEFIQIVSRREVIFRVWERGASETLACGTGACASVVASVLNGLTDRSVLVHLPGGDLQIEWSEENNHVYMTGVAQTVYTGEIELPLR